MGLLPPFLEGVNKGARLEGCVVCEPDHLVVVEGFLSSLKEVCGVLDPVEEGLDRNTLVLRRCGLCPRVLELSRVELAANAEEVR